MKLLNKVSKFAGLGLISGLVFVSCQKMDHPAAGDYPKDTNPPGGALKFFAAFDGSTADPLRNGVDSIRANFPASNTADFDDGISGKSYKGSEDAFAQYGGANDFAASKSFTIAFWIKKTPQAAGKGTNFAFGLNSGGYSWTNLKLFLEFEDAGNPSTVDSAAAKLYILDQWFEYVGTKRMKNVLNGQWHHLAFTYDEATSTLKTYIDGVPPTNLPAGFGNVTNGGAPRGKLDFISGNSISGFTIGGPGTTAHNANTWMNNFDGSLDQFRLYSTVLSDADISALFTNKQ
ncbi:MAG: LamG domain-containing protein [Ferruginibacter sp.]